MENKSRKRDAREIETEQERQARRNWDRFKNISKQTSMERLRKFF